MTLTYFNLEKAVKSTTCSYCTNFAIFKKHLSKIITYGLLIFSNHTYAASTHYQIDLIIFTHHVSSLNQIETQLPSLLGTNASHAILLQDNPNTNNISYHLLPNSRKQLRNEYLSLSRRPEYQVLLHYSWLQPNNNQHAVALPQINHNGWNIKGFINVRRSNYYLLDAELFFAPTNRAQTGFLFSQKQRLKSGVVYYLDNPQAGIIIKIHAI